MTNINEEIKKLNKWQRATLAAMCTTSMSPIVVRFAEPITRLTFEQGLNEVWDSVQTKGIDSQVVFLRNKLEDLPESECDDSHLPSYYVMCTIAILAYTLDSLIEDESYQSTIDACTNANGELSGYDHILIYGDEILSIDPKNPPPPERLESLLIQLQVRSIEDMQNAAQLNSQIVNQIRNYGNQMAVELDRVLPSFIERIGWSL
jgi:hypothetical protein